MRETLDIPGIYILYYETDDYQYYIGKSINIRTRYKRHCRDLARGKHRNLGLKTSFSKYSAEPSIAVLEAVRDLDSLCDREIYWIKMFDSFNNGMNETIGGDGSGFGENSPVALYTEETYVNILKELGNVNNSIYSIAKKYNVSENVVNNISSGNSHTYLKIIHPTLWNSMIFNIGKRTNKIYPEQAYIEIVELLSQKFSLLDVAELTEIPYYIISNISRGASHCYLESIMPEKYSLMRKYAKAGYYLRVLEDQVYVDILEMLAYTNLSYNEIAEKTNSTTGIVTSISVGTAHKYLKEEYPETYFIVCNKFSKNNSYNEDIKKTPRLFKHSEEVYINIMKELANTNKKLNIISVEYGVDQGVVEDISRGSTHKYLEKEYPEVYKKMIDKKGKRRAGSQSGNAYPAVKDPEGNIYENIVNAKQFAIEHNLHPGHFGDLLRGKARSHKSWIIA